MTTPTLEYHNAQNNLAQKKAMEFLRIPGKSKEIIDMAGLSEEGNYRP